MIATIVSIITNHESELIHLELEKVSYDDDPDKAKDIIFALESHAMDNFKLINLSCNPSWFQQDDVADALAGVLHW